MKQKPILLGVLLATFIHAQPPSAAARITLDEAIQEGLVKNLDIAAEKLNISVAEARATWAAIDGNAAAGILAKAWIGIADRSAN